MVPMLSHDLLPSNPGLEVLVATQDGTLACLAQNNKTGLLRDSNTTSHFIKSNSWSGERRTVNDFSFGVVGVQM